MVDQAGTSPEFDDTYQEAADWFARLHDAELTVEETMEWLQLMAQPDFAHAYARLEETWNTFDDFQPARPSGRAQELIDHYDASVPVSSWLRRTRRLTEPRRRMALKAAAALILAIGAGWLIVGSPGSAQVVQTPAGQNQAFILADGSRVNLGAGTRLEIRYGTRYRHIDLVRGEAFFAVAKDAKRPFTVKSGDASVTAVGTEFSVNRAPDKVVIAVIEGRVIVASGESRMQVAAPLQKPLAAGEQIAVSSKPSATRALANSVPSPVGWRNGRLAFQSEPLSRVLLDVNRYASKPIAVDDPSLGDLMITGTVLRSDVNGWLASLENSFPLRVIDDPDQITIRSR